MADGPLIVFGSLNMDIVVSVERHPHPGETIAAHDMQFYPGGKGANQAIAAARFGARVELIGAVGADEFGRKLLSELRTANVNVEAVSQRADKSTGTALITVGKDGQNSIVVVSGANATVEIPPEYLTAFSPSSWKRVTVLAQFETPLDMTERFFTTMKQGDARTILNPSPFQPIPHSLLAQCDILIVNEVELAQMTETARSDDPDAALRAVQTLSQPNRFYIVTLGAKGCLVVSDGDVTHVQAEKVDVVDTTGAGDCFAGVFAAQVCKGVTYEIAARRANAAAALSTTRHGASPSMPTSGELREFRRPEFS